MAVPFQHVGRGMLGYADSVARPAVAAGLVAVGSAVVRASQDLVVVLIADRAADLVEVRAAGHPVLGYSTHFPAGWDGTGHCLLGR